MDDLILHALIAAGIVLLLNAVGFRILHAGLVALAVGIIKEGVDLFTPGTPDWADVGADLLGVALGIGAALFLREAAKRLPVPVIEPTVEGKKKIRLRFKRYQLKVRAAGEKEYRDHKAKQIVESGYDDAQK